MLPVAFTGWEFHPIQLCWLRVSASPVLLNHPFHKLCEGDGSPCPASPLQLLQELLSAGRRGHGNKKALSHPSLWLGFPGGSQWRDVGWELGPLGSLCPSPGVCRMQTTALGETHSSGTTEQRTDLRWHSRRWPGSRLQRWCQPVLLGDHGHAWPPTRAASPPAPLRAELSGT